jgi:hypothetical protein
MHWLLRDAAPPAGWPQGESGERLAILALAMYCSATGSLPDDEAASAVAIADFHLRQVAGPDDSAELWHLAERTAREAQQQHPSPPESLTRQLHHPRRLHPSLEPVGSGVFMAEVTLILGKLHRRARREVTARERAHHFYSEILKSGGRARRSPH